MSPSEIGRIQPIAPGNAVARDYAAASAKSPAESPKDSGAETAVKVETSGSIEPGQPPVDQSRVETIRRAVENGTYPVNPAEIADAIIAAPLLLSAE